MNTSTLPGSLLPISLLGAASGLGGRSLSIGNAPAALRRAGLVAALQNILPDFRDCGDVMPDSLVQTAAGQGGICSRDALVAFLNTFAVCVKQESDQGRVPLVIGGDHSVSTASISATVTSLREKEGRQARVGLLWVDAHGDIHTPASSPSGNAHGMTIAALLGYGDSGMTQILSPEAKLAPEHLAYIALRDLEQYEKEFIRDKKILAFSMKEIDRYGLVSCLEQALDRVNTGTQGFAFSFDLDVCDPVVFSSISLPCRGGLSYRESHLLMELVAERSGLLEMSFCEYDPGLDTDGSAAEIAVSLLESAFGKTILL